MNTALYRALTDSMKVSFYFCILYLLLEYIFLALPYKLTHYIYGGQIISEYTFHWWFYLILTVLGVFGVSLFLPMLNDKNTYQLGPSLFMFCIFMTIGFIVPAVSLPDTYAGRLNLHMNTYLVSVVLILCIIVTTRKMDKYLFTGIAALIGLNASLAVQLYYPAGFSFVVLSFFFQLLLSTLVYFVVCSLVYYIRALYVNYDLL